MSTIVRRGPSGPTLAHRNHGSLLLTFHNRSNQPSPSALPAEHLNAQPSILETNNSNGFWVRWGLNDDHPDKVAQLIRKSTIGRANIRRLTQAIYGQKLFTYKTIGYGEDGTEQIAYAPIPEWEAIKRRSNFNAVRIGLIQDYVYYGICYPEPLFNGNKSKVFGLDYDKASHCRMAKADDAGYIPKIYVSGNFPRCAPADCLQIPVIDMIRYYDQMDDIRADFSNLKYVIPTYWPDVINDYYPEVFWYSAKDNLDIATSIPVYIKSLFKNQMSLKYHIQIPTSYFRFLYKNWDSLLEDEQNTIIDNLYDDILKNLTGTDNAMKAIMTFYDVDKSTGKPTGQWTIDVIDDKYKNDAYLPNASAANSEINFAFGINPAVNGQGNTGGDYTGGANNGGSNIREGGLDLRSSLQADRDILNTFFSFIRDYNEWDPEICLGVQDQILTTTDTGAGTKKIIS